MGIRLVGANSIGTANFAHGAMLTVASALQEILPQDGPIAIISQGGAVGVAVNSECRTRGHGRALHVCGRHSGRATFAAEGEALAHIRLLSLAG